MLRLFCVKLIMKDLHILMQKLPISIRGLLKGDAFWLFFVIAALDVMLALKLKKPFARLAKLVRDSAAE